MKISMFGVNFRSASIDAREAFSFNANDLPAKLQMLKSLSGVFECVILSTCNRIELYVVTDDEYETDNILKWWQSERALEDHQLLNVVYQCFGLDAVKHLIRVASGLDSMVLGEAQILGQIKESFAMAKLSKTVSRTLSRLFDHAFFVAKEVRTRTAIGHCPVSMACSAVMLVRDRLDSLSDKHVLIIGAGQTAELIAKHILSARPKSITVANRTFENAKLLANKLSATNYADLSTLPEQVIQADIVIAAVHTRTPLVSLETVVNLASETLFIDLSVPRAISTCVQQNAQATLYSVDDLQGLIQKNTAARERAALVAEDIVAQNIQRYTRAVKADQADSAICAVRLHTEKIVSDEVEKSLKQLEGGKDPINVLLHFAHSIKNKWLHSPSVTMRQASEEGRDEILGLAQELFGLKVEGKDEKIH
jgi:glutamyl-tRNA reductase